jgi:hypothetical protein
MTIRRHLASVLALTVLLGACAQPMPKGQSVNSAELSAKVVAIDRAQRAFTLESDQGNLVVMKAPDEMRNFDQMQVGDTVLVTYTEAIAWEVTKGSPQDIGVTDSSSVSRAAPGEKPGATTKEVTTVTAAITAIDLQKETVTLRGPSGRDLTLKPRDPSKLKQVSVGDVVRISYSEALAIAVRPATPAAK